MTKRKEKTYSIQIKIFLTYICLLIAASACIFGFSVRSFRRTYYREVNSHMEDISALSSTNVANHLEQIDQLSVSVLIDPVVQSHMNQINKISSDVAVTDGAKSLESYKAEISKQIRGNVFNVSGIVSLRIYGLYGDEIFIGTTNREYLEYSVTPEEIYAAGGAAVWRMAGDNHYACMCRAILDVDDMQPLGYMVIVCRNEYFREELTTFTNAYSAQNYLLDEDGYVVSADQEEWIGELFPCPLEELDGPGKGRIEDPVTGEESYYYLGARLKSNWRLLSLVQTSYFADGIRKMVCQIGIVLCAVLLVSFAATFVVVRQLLGPTQKLLQTISDFGDGNLNARIDLKGRDEIGQIGRAYNEMADNIQNLMEKVYTLELANREAESEFLKMQINPHFLYNSLDTISWLGFTDGNEKITDLAVALARLLRSSIKGADMITVREEMQMVQDYLKIQSYRFEDRITISVDVPEDVMDYEMPGFLMQPLIENSIIHGLEEQNRKGNLWLGIRRSGGYLECFVEDDGTGMEEEQVRDLMRQCACNDSRQALGLKNVYRRLHLLYGEACCFHIESSPQQGTRITFRIPVEQIFEKDSTGGEQ